MELRERLEKLSITSTSDIIRYSKCKLWSQARPRPFPAPRSLAKSLAGTPGQGNLTVGGAADELELAHSPEKI